MHDFAVESNGARPGLVGHDACQHLVQFYETDAFLAGAVARFIGDGLCAGHPAVIIATPPHREAFMRFLSARDVNLPRALAEGWLVVLDAQQTLDRFMVDGACDWSRFQQVVGGVLEGLASARPGRGIRAYGEMVDVLWRAGQQGAAVQLEGMWNELQRHHELELLCAYAIDSFYEDNGILEICATHSRVLPPERDGQRGVPETVQTLISEIAQRTELERTLRGYVRHLARAEEEARRSKDELEDFLSNAVVAIHRVDKDGIIRWANAAELDMLGYRADEYIGHHIAEFHADRAVIDDILVRLTRGETLRDFEVRMRTKSGEIRIIELSSNVRRQDGEFVTTRCFGRDVTEIKSAERRTEVLYAVTSALSRAMSSEEAARIVIREARGLVEAQGGSVLLLDAACQRVDRLVVDSPDREAAAKLSGVVLEADLPICEAARSGNIVWIVGADAIQRRYPHHVALRGELPIGTWGALPIKYEDRSIGAIGLRCIAERPLTREEEVLLLAVGRQFGQAIERARLHEAAELARQDAEQASRAKDEFLAILGHELRNPLSPILTAVQLMRLRGEVSSAREQNVIERQVTHLIHIVDDLLDISRVARGKIQLECRPLKLSTVIAKALEITGPLCEERGHRVNVTLPDDDVWLEADETRLCQVFTNLLSNAAKYTPRGGLIELTVQHRGDRVEVCVRDNGIGIAPDLLPRMFDLFVQGKRIADKGGLGIGLALVRTLVRMHGGTVIARSAAVGRGSEFIVELPKVEVRREPPPTETEWSLRTRVEMTPRRILVVDDNEDAGALLGEMLRSVGHEVVVALDGPRALEAVKHFHPEVAILDIGLPVMDGYELAAVLRDRLGSSVRLLAVTGYGQEQDRARTAQSGFESHFVKPVALQKVLAAIEVSAAQAP